VTTAAVVQVVTADTDWPAIVTGAVGAVGIVLTFLQGRYSLRAQSADLRASLDAATQNLRISIAADDARARQADRRQLYVHCQVALSALRVAAVRVRAEQAYGPARDGVAMDAFTQADLAAREAVWPVVISGSPEVAELASRLLASVSSALADPAQDEGFRQAQSALIGAMQADLATPGGGGGAAGDRPAATASAGS
jgi:hypothetical protein